MKNAVRFFAIFGILVALVTGICLYISFTNRGNEPVGSDVDVLYVGLTEGDFTYTVFSDYTCEITKYSGWDIELDVPKTLNTCPVVGIGSYAFEDCDSLLKVDLPKTVRYIEYRAFAECALLKEVDIPSTVRYIGEEAFYGDDELQAVKCSGNLAYIGDSAFEGCDSLVSAVFGGGVKELGNRAFFGCVSLNRVKLGKDLASVGNYAFGNCKALEKIGFGEGLLSIGLRAFDSCSSLSKIKLPSTVASIGRYAFEGTPWRDNAEGFVVVGSGILVAAGKDVGPEVVIPDNVLVVGDAFENRTDITSVVVPDSVAEIGDGAFMGCISLESAEVTAINKLGSYAFYGCEKLDDVILPYGLSDIGKFCFVGTSWVKNGDYVIAGDGILFGINTEGNHAVVPDSVKYVAEAFYKSEYLAVTIGNNVEKILPNAFAQSEKLKKVNFGSSVTELGENAFADCSSLKSVAVNEGVTLLGDKCFYCCYALEDITLPSTLNFIGNNAFGLCYELESVEWDISEGTVIDDNNDILTKLLN